MGNPNDLAPFIFEKEYKRRDIHMKYGGNWQGGICPSREYPYIFIFTGESGHQHGYFDGWENDKVFRYAGEGQVGDMEFIRGNMALRDHLKNGKRVFLFQASRKSYVKFISEMVFLDSDYFEGEDREGNKRSVIMFFLARAGKTIDYLDTLSLLSEPDTPFLTSTNKPNVTEREGLVLTRVGHGAYRKSIIHRWENKCAVTGYNDSKILIASHIHPWKDSTDDERLDVNNGILLSPTYDALFDKHLISFENNGKIILSDSLLKHSYQDIGVTGKEVVKKLHSYNHFYLEKHRGLLLK